MSVTLTFNALFDLVLCILTFTATAQVINSPKAPGVDPTQLNILTKHVLDVKLNIRC